MDTSLIPVTESEMNAFFNGVSEFQHRVATSIVAHSEQVKRIDELTLIVERLQASVDALTNTVRQLTEDRDQARKERDEAQYQQMVAIERADILEKRLQVVANELKERDETIAIQHNNIQGLESVVSDLRSMNGQQENSLKSAIEANQGLQDTIVRLQDDLMRTTGRANDFEHDIMERDKEIKRLTNMLSVAKTVLDGVPLSQITTSDDRSPLQSVG